MKRSGGVLAAQIEVFHAQARAKAEASGPVDLAAVVRGMRGRAKIASDGGGTPRVRRAASKWRFCMLGLDQIGHIWDAIEELPPKHRPRTVDRVFKLVLRNLKPRSGEYLLSRAETGERLGVSADVAGEALSVLCRLGILRRERVPVPGLNGPGRAVYFVNPDMAWNGDEPSRLKAGVRRAGPLLSLMEGGKREHDAARDLAPTL